MSKEKLTLHGKTFLADAHTIENVVKKVGIQWPSNNIALLQTVYAATETANLNDVRLGVAGMEKALPTLIGAQANLNHSADYAPLGFGFIIGIVLDAWLDANQDINIIFSMAKNIYAEEYQRALNMLADGTLSVSFELMNDPASTEHLADGTIRLHDYEFTGVGLLLDANPAYPKAKVYEMAKTYKERAVEEKELMYASKIVASCEKVLADMNTVSDPVMTIPEMQCNCPFCFSPMTWDNTMYDADNMMYHRPCISMGPIAKPYHIKANKWSKKFINSLPNSSFAVIEPAYLEGKTDNKDARHLPYKNSDGTIDLPHYKNALARVNQVIPVTDSISTEELRSKALAELNKHKDVLKKADKTENLETETEGGQNQMTEEQKKLIADLRVELADFAKDVSDEDILSESKIVELRQAKADAEKLAETAKVEEPVVELVEPTLETVSASLTEAQARNQVLEAENISLKAQVAEYQAKEQAIEDAKKAEKLAATKTELKDNPYTKDFSDEDYMNEVKVKEAKILKENDDLKAENEALKKAKAEVIVEAPKKEKVEASVKTVLETGHTEELQASVGIGNTLRKLGKKELTK